MGKSSIEEFFNKELEDKNFDRKLLQRLNRFRLGWATKSPEYIDFLGSKLFGVHPIRFSTIDEDNLYEIVFNIDNKREIQKRLYKVKGIEKNFKVVSNLINQLLVYTMYRFYNNKGLKEDEREDGVRECLLIMQYRFTSSLYYNYFDYQVEENIAISVYERLSHKFLIKQLDNWQEVYVYRANTVLDRNSPNNKRLRNYDTEDAVRIISDIQTKVRTNIVTMFDLLVKVKDEDDVISQLSSSRDEGDGLLKLSDTGGTITDMVHKVESSAYSPNDFIDSDLISIVVNIFNNSKKDDFLTILKFLTDKGTQDRKVMKRLNKCMDYDRKTLDLHVQVLKDIININTSYLQRINLNITDPRTIGTSIISIRNYWSSGKVTDKRLSCIKRYLNTNLTASTGKGSKWFLTTNTLMFIIYVHLLGLKK